MWGNMNWESYHDMKGEPIDSKDHYDDIMMGDQVRCHPDLAKMHRFGFFSIMYYKIKNFFRN